jgi:hypothetical protein
MKTKEERQQKYLKNAQNELIVNYLKDYLQNIKIYGKL